MVYIAHFTANHVVEKHAVITPVFESSNLKLQNEKQTKKNDFLVITEYTNIRMQKYLIHFAELGLEGNHPASTTE